jgi:hypothetical protein
LFTKEKGGNMKKKTIEYGSQVDALVGLAKRLAIYENKYGMESEEFFDKYTKGLQEDSEIFIRWANDYQHYLAMRDDIEEVVASEKPSIQEVIGEARKWENQRS